MSAYHPLNETEAIAIALTLTDVFPAGAALASREIGDGNLNLVFHISDPASGRSIIMKQALPYAKVVGESWPLTLDRARIESEALIQEGKLAPGLVPKVYSYDADLALTIMEDLSDHVIMRRGLIEGGKYPLFAEHISTFLAQTLFFTSDLGMNQQDKKNRVRDFINPELCKITEDLIFDHPYTDADTNNFDEAIRDEAEALWNDGPLQLEVALLREKFLTQAQALLHGDLHTGSIFITPDSTKVIDPEFAYFGPIGFDIGAIIANLLTSFASRGHWDTNEAARDDFRSYLLVMIRDLWTKFDIKFRALWEQHGVDRLAAAAPGYKDDYMLRLLRDTIGYAGSKIVRRIVGLAHVAEIGSIPDAAAREQAQRLALAIGKSLIKLNRSATSIDELIHTAQTAAGSVKV
ncbi:S-methyl-5-thioribose kinase [Paenibacillus oenotherae]|uniref:Methylthioribose kinase n=1 Tax=Paenibacillus oenotherae TaxID=1435645 RepID=A0ABS7DDG7_9BACL|nr:S-methyl-5-thioribose kinase [Paenibacillus oenotherae]MBW7477804.1 S-methyl-5-thioribose kinase [Paenibacillus oenotherae]